MDKSLSTPDISSRENASTPPNFVSQRNKRRREFETDDMDLAFSSFKEEMKEMIKTLMEGQEIELKKITPTLMEIKETNCNIENSIAFLTAQNDEFKKKIEQIELQSRKDKEYITLLEEKLEDMQRGSRKANIEIKNVPKSNKETKDELINMVMSLAKNIDCKITKTDIRDIYRVQGKKDAKTNTPIIVETSSTILKTDILKLSKTYNYKQKQKLCAKHLGITKNEDTPIYVSEQLTARGSRLFFLARDLAKSKGYKFSWTSYGKIYVRQDEHSPIIAIKSEAQVNNLMQKK
ncbi:uncharacterized protein LOC125490636 [Plutella xylostella]|uniref:uncharacterized protein LOC125490636 n=1 Tax=Plutella xylostella TaxID=51655 RepID=UPI0020327425|nr:uncharacterized protein LOC125490636 [Plutella xylostella]